MSDPRPGAPKNEDLDSERFTRFDCQILVTKSGATSGVIGQATNIGVDGMLVETPAPLPKGHIVPLALTVPNSRHPLVVEAEILRSDAHTMAVRFVRMSRKDSRALRNLLLLMSETTGLRATTSRMHDVSRTSLWGETNPENIRELLSRSAKNGSEFVLIPESRGVRWTGKIKSLDGKTVQLDTIDKKHTPKLKAGEHVIGFYRENFTSFSFQATVVESSSERCSVALPAFLHCAERRSATRSARLVQGFVSLRFGADAEPQRYALHDVGAGGFGFTIPPSQPAPRVGDEVCDVRFDAHDAREENTRGVVKYVKEQRDEKAAWVRVGVSYAIDRQPLDVIRHDELLGPVDRLLAFGQGVKDKAAYLVQSKIVGKKQRSSGEDVTVVRFNNQANHEVVGILDTVAPIDKRVRCPCVIITPAYGLRKEAMGALALTLIENFRSKSRDLAVLRIDGTNNAGESYQEPGFEADHKQTINYTHRDAKWDLSAALKWVKDNRYFDASDIVLVSVSYSTIGARQVMASPEGECVSRWISYMGPADAAHGVRNASGHVDFWGNYLRGVKSGITYMAGCLLDGDNTCKALDEEKAATLEDARRDLARIRAHVTWIVGKHDAYFDSSRVHDIMSVPSPGARDIVEVNSGHIPRQSDVALAQFVLMAKLIWKHFYGHDVEMTSPSLSQLARLAARETARLKRQIIANPVAWWRDYLLAPGVGFDVRELTPEYRDLMQEIARDASVAGKHVVDIGAGTGALEKILLTQSSPPAKITAIDFVPEAILALQATSLSNRVTTLCHNVDGGPQTVMKRWLAGAAPSVTYLAARMPSFYAQALRTIAQNYNDTFHAVLRGACHDVEHTLGDTALATDAVIALRDLHVFARYCRGLLSEKEALSLMHAPAAEALFAPCGLPLPDASADRVVCSLVLNYLAHPQDVLWESARVLNSDGMLLLVCHLPDADESEEFLQLIEHFEACDVSELPMGHSRESLIKAVRLFHDQSNQVARLAERGAFAFWPAERLQAMVAEAGFAYQEGAPTYGANHKGFKIKAFKTRPQ